MIAWIFAEAWHAVVGLLLLLTFLFGAVVVLAKAIAQGAEHDRDRCMCGECQGIRKKAYARKYANQSDKNKKTAGWLTTYELHTNMRVESRGGSIYQVTGRRSDTQAITILLREETRGTESFVRIPHRNATQRIWKQAK